MFKLNTMLLRDKGIRKPKAYLRGFGLGHVSAQRWEDGQLAQLNLEALWKVCLDLNCTPNDLLVPAGALPEGHSLAGLRPDEGPDALTLLQGMTGGELRALKEQLRGRQSESGE